MTSDIRIVPMTHCLLRQTIVALAVSAALAAVAVISCTQDVQVTVEVEVTREVPVTREVVVTRQVEVTRLVEVTAQATPTPEDVPAIVKACLGVKNLFAQLLETVDLSTGEPAMSEDEIAMKWLPILADVYDSGNEELIQAVDTLIATPIDAPDSTFEELTFEIILICTDYVDW